MASHGIHAIDLQQARVGLQWPPMTSNGLPQASNGPQWAFNRALGPSCALGHYWEKTEVDWWCPGAHQGTAGRGSFICCTPAYNIQSRRQTNSALFSAFSALGGIPEKNSALFPPFPPFPPFGGIGDPCISGPFVPLLRFWG